MNRRCLFALGLSFVLLAGCGGGTNAPSAVPAPPATNDNGNVVTGTISAQFDPSNGILPFPNNLLFLGTDDLSLNVPADDPADFSDPAVALSALDGFSTTAPWAANFIGTTQDGSQVTLNPATVTPGNSVRVFEITVVTGTIAPNGLVRELTPGVDYVAVASGAATVAIIPLRPLAELADYMAVLTNDIEDINGNDATADQTYFIGKRTSPLVDANGASTDPLLDNATAQALEPLRQIINAQEAVAAAAGIDPAKIILSWTVTTQSITPIMSVLRSTVQPAPVTAGPTGLTTAAAGGVGIADIWAGVITLPYYLGAPSAENPTAPLNEFWEATPGAYIPPFDAFGLSPNSTNVTVANPIPVVKSMQTVPILITVPNAGAGIPAPASGWPVVIFQHGITRNRTDALAIADTLASIGVAVVSIDQPLHGVVPAVDPALAPFYIEGTPFGPIANERTFDADYVSNTTGAAGPDGITDASGTHTINLLSLLTSRDNLRQASIDLSVVAATLSAGLDISGDGIPDFDSSNISFVGQSLGAIVGTPFLAVEATAEGSAGINSAVLSVPGGGITAMLVGSQTFGPRIVAGLAAAGIQQGTADFDAFVVAAQTVIDGIDPINWGGLAAATNPILLHEVIGDAVIPNAVDGAPLSGTEPLIAVMELPALTATTMDAAGVRAAARFAPPAGHGSLLSPADSVAATVEMQGQMASMIATSGTTVVVADPSVLVTE